MTLMKKVECYGVVVDLSNYIPVEIQFIPDQHFRNYSDCYIVDKSRKHILKLGTNLNFIKLISFEDPVTKIITGPLSPFFLVQFGNNKIRDVSEKLSKQVEYPENEIKCACAFNSGIVIVDIFGKMCVYENSDYIKKELGLAPNSDPKFEYVQTPMDALGIEDVYGGFFHVVFRTKNGRIFASGYDIMKQVSFGANLDGKPNLSEHPLNIGHCKRAGCFSRGQYLVNTRNDIFFVAEMFTDFNTNFTHNTYNFVQVMNFDDINFQTKSMRKGENYNIIVNCGWHTCIAFDVKLIEKPSRFKNLLFDCSAGGKITDISITFE